jgi:hypothetical protein
VLTCNASQSQSNGEDRSEDNKDYIIISLFAYRIHARTIVRKNVANVFHPSKDP